MPEVETPEYIAEFMRNADQAAKKLGAVMRNAAANMRRAMDKLNEDPLARRELYSKLNYRLAISQERSAGRLWVASEAARVRKELGLDGSTTLR